MKKSNFDEKTLSESTFVQVTPQTASYKFREVISPRPPSLFKKVIHRIRNLRKYLVENVNCILFSDGLECGGGTYTTVCATGDTAQDTTK